MSLYDYEESQRISAQDYQFYALLFAAMRKADSYNVERLQDAFPEEWAEFVRRYNAPAGVLPEDGIDIDAYLTERALDRFESDHWDDAYQEEEEIDGQTD